MKRCMILAVATLCLSPVFLSACSDGGVISKPEDTTLEFWVAEKVSAEDFNGYDQIVDISGGYLYLGEGYHLNETADEYGSYYPDHYVKYTVTAYPDYSSNGGNFDTVTRIEVTDPEVTVGGITCNSSLEEFDAVFRDLGCSIQDKGIIHIATYKNTQIAFADYDGNEIITISVNVTNKEGIVF